MIFLLSLRHNRGRQQPKNLITHLCHLATRRATPIPSAPLRMLTFQMVRRSVPQFSSLLSPSADVFS